MIIDTHCHIYNSEMENAEEVIKECAKNNIYMILNGIDPKSNKEVLELANKYDNVYINSNDKCIPHIVNLSLRNIKSETMLHALERDGIYISTQTACSQGNYSLAVFSVTNDKEKAGRSIRISLSHLTTKDELDKFLEVFRINLDKLNILDK
jgi:cysteine sulfinate desulfinase/cysteine desulfurase-like protein